MQWSLSPSLSSHNRYNIELVGISSDGDQKLLSAMCHQIIQPGNELYFTQDPTHSGTKLRNRLLHDSVVLKIGNRTASVDDLMSLIKKVQKSVHGLTYSDIVPYDRMNFTSFGRMIDDRVLKALRQHIPNSEGTIKYLQICSDVTSSFLATDMKPLDRVFRMFRSVYFLRLWRQFIIANKTHRLGDNFISSNAYTGIEINCRHLLLLIKKFRDQHDASKFLPVLFDSQTCERSFRLYRSMGTMEFTRINFTLYDLTFMIGRAEVMNEIAYTKFDDEVIVPNIHKTKSILYELPSDDEINIIMSKAREAALDEAKTFGISCAGNIDEYDIHSRISSDDIDDEIDEEYNYDPDVELIDTQNIDGEKDPTNDSSGAFVHITDEKGIVRKVRKSTYIWMLTEPSQFLSKDRLARFKSRKRLHQ